jgi:hypothetical protein
MTAGREENAAAAAAQAGGEAEAADRARHAEQLQATIAGSAIDVTDTGRSAETAAVSWPSPSTAGQPPAVSPQP